MKRLFNFAGSITLIFCFHAASWAQPAPYLQTPTPTSIYISWHSTDTSFTKVVYGLSVTSLVQATSGSFQNIQGKIWHTVQLTGLSPSTTYFYQCISGADSSAVYPFRSQPQSGGPDKHFRFVVIGDSRNYDTIPTYLPTVCMYLKQTLIRKYGIDWYNSLNLVMHTGDIVWTGNQVERFENEYFGPISGLSCSVPFMISIGNHEHESPSYYDYMKYTDFTDPAIRPTPLNQRFYAFVLNNCQFVVLNSNKKLVGEPMQHSWLRKTLSESDADTAIDFVFPVSHHPYRSSIWSSGNCDSVKTMFFTVFNDFYKVAQYSYGHAHCYEQGVWDMNQPLTAIQHDMRLVLSGGGGAELSRYGAKSRNYPEIIKAIDDYCYTIFDVDVANRSYTAEAYSLGKPEHFINNLLFDSLHFRMNQPPPRKPRAYAISGGTPVTLFSSPIEGLDSCMSAEVQITQIPGNYTHPVLDTVRNFENYYENTGAPDFIPINKNDGINLYSFTIPEGRLAPGLIHGFRVRYRDMNVKWSAWSDEQLFNPNGIPVSGSFSSADIILGQNYPNPFVGKTTIPFEVKTRQKVRLVLIDPAGREVMVLLNGDVSPGTYKLSLTTGETNIAPGVYFIRLSGENASDVKMLMAK